jgi:flagellum-specific peptidoglycan hydrolase FlgJ
MLTEDQAAALSLIAAAAVAGEKATGLPAELSAAQCIFESGWLARSPGNNCFGIKADGHGAGTQYVVSREFLDGAWVTETEAFEKYASLAACFADHARLITTLAAYAPGWEKYQQDHDVDRLILAIGPIYATDPGYAEEILEEAHAADVTAAIAEARKA